MKLAYDCELMRPGSDLMQLELGGDLECASAFDPKYWLTTKTNRMIVRDIDEFDLKELAKVTARYHGGSPQEPKKK